MEDPVAGSDDHVVFTIVDRGTKQFHKSTFTTGRCAARKCSQLVQFCGSFIFFLEDLGIAVQLLAGAQVENRQTLLTIYCSTDPGMPRLNQEPIIFYALNVFLNGVNQDSSIIWVDHREWSSLGNNKRCVRCNVDPININAIRCEVFREGPFYRAVFGIDASQ